MSLNRDEATLPAARRHGETFVGAMKFWAVATLMVVATTATLVVPLFWRARPDTTVARSRWFALTMAAAIPLLALGIYAWTGRPELAAEVPVAALNDDVARQHARAAMRGGVTGGELDAAIEKLRARLAANPEDPAGWRLLAQSYEFQGRAADAREANEHAEAVERGDSLPAAVVAPMATDAATRLAQTAEEHRRRREFPQAVRAYAELARTGGMSADLWADYADALGGARGTLDGEAAACIDAALRLDPDHPKALWLRASVQTQQQDFAAALVTWQRLARILPAESPDARIIAANLEEARARVAAGAMPSKPATQPPAIALRGSVSLDPRLRKQVGTGAVLFVFARAADERGPPLAVLRTAAGTWPIAFVLDDTDAMMPERKLSGFRRVILEARISRSGNALAQPGDLRAVSGVLDPATAPDQQLTIAEEVGAAATAQGG